jgi:hypothetical protein
MPSPFISVNGAINLLSSRQGMASAGSYFTVTNPTIGTPVVGATNAAWSATANGMFVIANSGSKTIFLDRMYLRLRSTAPTGTLTMQFEAYNETGIVTGTGNVTTRTPVGINTGLGQTTGATVQAFAAGAITIPAAAATATRRLQDTASLTTGVAVDGDTYELQFGQDGVAGGKNGGAAARATDPAHIVAGMGPVCVAPNTTSWINMWWLTQAANVPSWEYGLSYIEI